MLKTVTLNRPYFCSLAGEHVGLCRDSDAPDGTVCNLCGEPATGDH